MKRLNRVITTGKTGRKQRGFTLLEFLISIGFMSALAGLISGSTLLSIRTNTETGAIADVAVETAKTTRWLVRDVHRAETTTLVDLAPPTNIAAFLWNDGGPVTCTYSIVNGDMQRNCATAHVVGNNVSNLQFSRNGNLITVSYDIVPPQAVDKAQTINLNIALGGG